MIEAALAKARSAWALEDARITLVAARENRVYRVERPSGAVLALRLHRPGYRSEVELRSEVDWMKALARSGACLTPATYLADDMPTTSGGGYQMSVVSWLTGQSLAQALPTLAPNARISAFARIGRSMARLHQASDAWTPPSYFSRPSWDLPGLLGDHPLWGRFWENPGLESKARSDILAARDSAREKLSGAVDALDYGLIHADLVRENILLTDEGPAFIDFDDGGWGYRIFDVATTLHHVRSEPDYPALEHALLSGYHELRPLDTALLPLFLLLRSFTYLGWIIPRLDEPGAEERNARFIANATTLAHDWLTREAGHKFREDRT